MTNYPMLQSLLNQLEKDKMFAYMSWQPGGYYDHPYEKIFDNYFDLLHDVYDTTLSNTLFLEDRYRLHDQLDYAMYQAGLFYLSWDHYQGEWICNLYEFTDEQLELLESQSPFGPIQNVWVTHEELGI